MARQLYYKIDGQYFAANELEAPLSVLIGEDAVQPFFYKSVTLTPLSTTSALLTSFSVIYDTYVKVISQVPIGTISGLKTCIVIQTNAGSYFIPENATPNEPIDLQAIDNFALEAGKVIYVPAGSTFAFYGAATSGSVQFVITAYTKGS